MQRTVEIQLRRKRICWERCTVTVEVTDEDALKVRAYEGPPEDHDFCFAAEDAAKPPPDGWEPYGERMTIEDLDAELMDIEPSLESEPPSCPDAGLPAPA